MLKEKSNNPPTTAVNPESDNDCKLGMAFLLVQESHPWHGDTSYFLIGHKVCSTS